MAVETNIKMIEKSLAQSRKGAKRLKDVLTYSSIAVTIAEGD